MTSILPIPFGTQTIAGLACLLLCVIAVMARTTAAKKHETRLRQLEKSSELFDLYARNLDVFLGDPGAPVLLKRVMMQFSCFMEDRAAVRDFAFWMSSQPLGRAVADADMIEIIRAAELLRHEQPRLASAFSSALVCGGFGAILRWPESARLFERTAPAFVADGSHEVAAAVKASRMRSQQTGFGLGRMAPAH